MDGLSKGPRRLLLPGGTVHATIERSSGEEWNVYVGDERRVTVVRRVVANNTVFLVQLHSASNGEMGECGESARGESAGESARGARAIPALVPVCVWARACVCADACGRQM